uniref:Transposase n=1 Tax=Macrostomum lignano TaxID=282301 RepID=A0A1I8F5M0_9PLAT
LGSPHSNRCKHQHHPGSAGAPNIIFLFFYALATTIGLHLCVEQGHKDCSEKESSAAGKSWSYVMIFCFWDGIRFRFSAATTLTAGSLATGGALEQAKRNLVDKYFLSGRNRICGKNFAQVPPSQATIDKLKKTPGLEARAGVLYDFAKRQFHYARNRAFTKHGDGSAPDGADLLEWREQRFCLRES